MAGGAMWSGMERDDRFDPVAQIDQNRTFFSSKAINQRLRDKFALRNEFDIDKELKLNPIKTELFENTTMRQQESENKNRLAVQGLGNEGALERTKLATAPEMMMARFTTDPERHAERIQLMKGQRKPSLMQAVTNERESRIQRDLLKKRLTNTGDANAAFDDYGNPSAIARPGSPGDPNIGPPAPEKPSGFINSGTRWLAKFKESKIKQGKERLGPGFNIGGEWLDNFSKKHSKELSSIWDNLRQ